jgi:hypothetical protein
MVEIIAAVAVVAVVAGSSKDDDDGDSEDDENTNDFITDLGVFTIITASLPTVESILPLRTC